MIFRILKFTSTFDPKPIFPAPDNNVVFMTFSREGGRPEQLSSSLYKYVQSLQKPSVLEVFEHLGLILFGMRCSRFFAVICCLLVYPQALFFQLVSDFLVSGEFGWQRIFDLDLLFLKLKWQILYALYDHTNIRNL